MSSKWNLITPTLKQLESKRETPRTYRNEMIPEVEEQSSKKDMAGKLFERKKRNFNEMDRGTIFSKRAPTAPIQSLITGSIEPLKMKDMDHLMNMPEIAPKSYKPQPKEQTVVSDGGRTRLEILKIDAGISIEKYLSLDEKLVDTDRNIGSSTVSSNFSKKANTNYLIKQKIKYPDILINIFNNQGEKEERFSFSGLFLPLNLLYFVRNNIIYLWDFQTDQIYTYKEISNVIVNLHITLPKTGVFSPEVSYIMIAATTTEIYLILIIHNENKTLNFIKSDFIYDVQNVITSICSTSERRVFLGSQNNYLFELDYTNIYSFFGFSKRAKKITHSSQSFFEKMVPNVFNLKKHSYITKLVVDNTRRLLYALIYFTSDERNTYNTESVYDSIVQIYDLGVDGFDFKKLGEISQTNIKERFSFLKGGSNFRKEKENSFLILDVYPITRAESKYYNLVIVTKIGLRAYISFDTTFSHETVKDEEKIIDYDKNKIYRVRPNMKYTMILKQIPEPSNATIIEGIESDLAYRALHRAFTYSQIFFIEKKFFIFYKDDSRKRSYIDVIEHEESDHVKLQEQYSHLNLISSKESISNILKFNFNKEVYTMLKVPYGLRTSISGPFELDFANLLKLSEHDNFLPRNVNFLDSTEHLSYSCMHSFAKQLFLPPEETIVMTSSELVTVSKMRPIDNLFKILSDIENIHDAFTEDFMSFIKEYGISETSFMLVVIMSNRNFVFYRKFEETVIQNESMFTDFNNNANNISNILMMNSTDIKNYDKLIYAASKYFLRMIEFASKGLSPSNIFQDKKTDKRDGKLISSENYIGQVAEDIYTGRLNYISYALFMYLARIGRVFWEEYLFRRSPDENEFVSESIKVHQIKYLQCLLVDFQIKIRDNKEKILQKSSEVDIKLKSFNKNIYDFSNLSQELDQVLYLSEKYIETLQLVEILYSLKSLKRHLAKLPKNLLKELTNVKFKDIILNQNMPMVKQWIEEYFEVALNESDYFIVGSKLDELCALCPNILSQNDKEVITANMLIRLSKAKHSDEISRKNLVSKAVSLMIQNPENIKLEKSIRLLGDLGEVRSIVEICIKKAIYLKAVLEKEGDRNLSILKIDGTTTPTSGSDKFKISQAQTESYFNEYKQALYLILKLLNEIHLSIINNDKPYTSNAPEYIQNIVQGKKLTFEEKISMRNAVIEEILKHDIKFLHDLLFDHLKSQGMLDDIVKYDSPYIEPYLSSQIEKEQENPKRYEALYKFYLNSNNYEGALRILLSLVNFDNSKINYGDKYVSLEDRRTYAKHLIHTLDKILDTSSDELNKNFYIKNRIQVVNMSDMYLIQAEILLGLKNLLQRVNDPILVDKIQQALLDLDRNYYSLNHLYEMFSKQFKLYEINLQIYFEMYSKNITIDKKEVKENYNNYFDLIEKKGESLKWPYVVFPLMNKLFVNMIYSKTAYESFTQMLKENHYNNVLDEIIPLDHLIIKIEDLNWNLMVKDKEIEFEQKSNEKYDALDNPFWFVGFLKEIVQIPCFYIFKLYQLRYTNCVQDNPSTFVLTIEIMHVIKLWCINVEIYFDRLEKKDTRIPKFITDDYEEFIKVQSVLQLQLRKIYLSYSKNSMRIILEEESRKKVVLFCQNVENKLEFVLNYYLKVSKKKSFEPTGIQNLDIGDTKYPKQQDIDTERNKDNFYQEKKPTYNTKSNFLDQCD